MVDKIAREQLASTLRSYMNEEITAFQFDELLGKFRSSPSDGTVRIIARDLWGCYDDIKDHKVVASKQAWDWFNRILLLLSSDAEIDMVRNGLEWHRIQVFSSICFVLSVLLVVRIGWRVNLFEVTCPFGLLSMVIEWFNQKRAHRKYDTTMYPFPSFGALSSIRRRAFTFVKSPYPAGLIRRKIRHPILSNICCGFLG